MNPPRQCRRRTQERFQQGKGAARARQSIGGTTRDTGNVWSLRSSLELGALPTAVSCARLHARHLVWEWGLDGLAETVELLVSELVTNAVQAMVRQENHTAVRLQLFSGQYTSPHRGQGCRIAAAGSQRSRPGRHTDVEGQGGRGLFLVAALSACWDWYLTQEPAGKVVWCELEAERAEPSEVGGPASQPLLPRRMPRQVQGRPVVVMNDPDILRRIRDGLRDLSDC